MSTDVVTVAESATLAAVAERLLVNHVGSVIVVDGDGAPYGILTLSDIVVHLSNTRKEAGGLASAREEWASEDYVPKG